MGMRKRMKKTLVFLLVPVLVFNAAAVAEPLAIEQGVALPAEEVIIPVPAEEPIVEEIPVVFEDVPDPDASVAPEQPEPEDELPPEAETEMVPVEIDLLFTSRQTAVTPVLSGGAELVRLYSADTAEEFFPDESGVYMLSAGEYLYDVRTGADGSVHTYTLTISEGADCVDLIVRAEGPQPGVVAFDLWQPDAILSVYSLSGDVRTEYQCDESGAYSLPAGEYFYDASLNGYAAETGVAFSLSAGETKYIPVHLVSDERAAVNRSANTLIFSLRAGSMQQAKIPADLQSLLDELGVTSAEYFYNNKRDDGGYESVYYALLDNDRVWYAIDLLSAREDIGYAEPDYLYFTSESGEYSVENAWATGDQSYMQRQPWIESLGVRSIWGKLESGKIRPGTGTIVAVIDTGVDYTHPDLASNMWVNTAELNGRDYVDDDGNGYIDDIYGYDFVSDDPDPKDDHGHGTHVAGIIGMADNGTGGVGLAYGAKVMAIKAGQATGSFSSSSIARAVLYARANGADVINMSFGGYSKSTIVENALQTAFADCVLVAAAGNDGYTTTDCPLLLPQGDMYPAGYSYVLGVMATDHSGTAIAGFSNWDWKNGVNCEYEIAAPGVEIYSTLPGGRYASWSGTSMAAPLVSAAAAIIRSQKGNDDAYSSRYIIGQLVGATQKSAANKYNSYPSLDILASLNYVPKPQLSVTGVKVFDSEEFSEANNGDGVWQNGETIELGLEITNRWGAASDISITADGLTDAGDPGFITFEDNTAAIGAVGTYATANTGYIYDDGELLGVSDPIRFTIGANVAHNVEIPINIHVTARNDMDPDDATVYTADLSYVITVENGAVISGILTKDTTLTADHMWIIRGSVQVPEGITLTVEPGTHIHFERTYTGDATIDWNYYPYLDIRGTASFNGTAEQPIEITTDSRIGIFGKEQYISCFSYGGDSFWAADCTMEYVNIHGGDVLPYYESESESVYTFAASGDIKCSMIGIRSGNHLNVNCTAVAFGELKNSFLENCAIACPNKSTGILEYSKMESCHLKETYFAQGMRYRMMTINNCTMDRLHAGFGYGTGNSASDISNNAILYRLNEPENWRRPNARETDNFSLANNYWGTENKNVISDIIIDSNDLVTYGTITYEPFLTKSSSELESIYPFVLDAWVEDADGNRIDTIVGAQAVSFHVLFNRDMDTSVQPTAAYGQAEPYNDYGLNGEWISKREWVAEKTVNPLIDYGTQYFRIQGAAAADDPWLTVGTDTRLWFEIANVGAEALELQSSAAADGIHLSWTQDDFETLAGFNLYRSQQMNENGRPLYPEKINDVLIPSDVLEYLDGDVVEGETYHYYFTVVQTDFAESDGSNVSTCTALDMTPPVIAHVPVDAVLTGEAIPVSAQVTDNVQVAGVTLYARAEGSEAWQAAAMTNTTENLYFASITTNAEGVIEYYIDATDGVGHAYAGSAEEPHRVSVRNLAVMAGDVNMDDGVDILDLMLIAHSIAGSANLGATQALAADVNGDGCVDIFDLMRVAQFVCGIIDSL